MAYLRQPTNQMANHSMHQLKLPLICLFPFLLVLLGTITGCAKKPAPAPVRELPQFVLFYAFDDPHKDDVLRVVENIQKLNSRAYKIEMIAVGENTDWAKLIESVDSDCKGVILSSIAKSNAVEHVQKLQAKDLRIIAINRTFSESDQEKFEKPIQTISVDNDGGSNALLELIAKVLESTRNTETPEDTEIAIFTKNESAPIVSSLNNAIKQNGFNAKTHVLTDEKMVGGAIRFLNQNPKIKAVIFLDLPTIPMLVKHLYERENTPLFASVESDEKVDELHRAGKIEAILKLHPERTSTLAIGLLTSESSDQTELSSPFEVRSNPNKLVVEEPPAKKEPAK